MESPENRATTHRNPTTQEPGARSQKSSAWLIWLLAIAFIALVIFTLIHRAAANREVIATTAELAVPTVQTTLPQQSPKTVDLVLPGNVAPFENTSVYARTDGYIKRWLVDIGAHVKEGQILAQIEAPDLDQQIKQAQAAAQQSKSDLDLAKVTADRWAALLKTRVVSKQDADEKSAAYTAAIAAFNAANANLARLQQLKDFQKVVAPFDGTITARNVNIGDLVNSSGGTSGSAATELFRIQQDNTLRVFINVPETDASDVKIGETANVELASSPGRAVKASVARTADTINPTSRTLLVELDIPNANHQLFAGGYATVHFPLHIKHPTLVLPVNTLLFRPDGTKVGVVGSDDIVKMQKVQIGRDYGTTVEITGGLAPIDSVILNPSDSLMAGDKVQVNNENVPKSQTE